MSRMSDEEFRQKVNEQLKRAGESRGKREVLANFLSMELIGLTLFLNFKTIFIVQFKQSF